MASTDTPFTSVEQASNAQRNFLTKTAINYQNESDVWGMSSDWTDTPINAVGTKVPLEISPNPSLKVVNLDGGSVGGAGARDLDSMTINYGQFQMASAVSYEALLNNNKETAGDQEVRRMESDVAQATKYLNDMVSRGNGTHALATASAAYDGTTATTKRTFIANGSTDSIGPSQTVVGQWGQIYNAAGTTARVAAASPADGIFKIESKTAANIVFLTGQSLPTDYISGDIFVPELGVANAATAFLAGFPYIFDDSGTYFNKSRSSVPSLQAHENNIAGSLTAATFFSTYANVKQRGGYGFGNNIELIDQLEILFNITQYTNYYNLSLAAGAAVGGIHNFQSDSSGKPKYDLGFASMDFSWFGAPMKVLNSTRGDEIYFSNKKCLKRAVLKNFGESLFGFAEDIRLHDVNGVGLLAKANYRDFIGQFFSPDPHRLGKISGITITSLPTQKAAMV